MLRVYGITFDHTTNYGSCFQAFALQTAIGKFYLGGKDKVNVDYQLIPIKNFMKFPVKNKLKNALISPILKLHRLRFKEFERKYMNYANVDNFAKLESLNQKADAFICGSDVIWNPDFNFGLGAFYLNFAEKYKFSYAASFGKAQLATDEYNDIWNYLPYFDAISVRERSGVDLVKNCIGIDAKVVADPVLLLKREVWSQLASTGRLHEKDPYIFVYTTHLNHTIKNFVLKLKKQTGLKIVKATCGPKQAIKRGILQVQTPEQWLLLLQNAEYVVTNSFHATAFSVLFHRKFFTVVQGKEEKEINVRMKDFLHEIALESRIYSSVPECIDMEEVEYLETDEKIDLLRRESLEFLRENLEEAYRRKNS